MAGGLVVSKVLTLFVTPVIYIYMERFTAWLRRHRPQPAPLMAGGEEVGAT